MFRIAFMKMMVLFRLAIIVSLVVYTLPNATLAMHGDNAPSVTASLDDAHTQQASMDDSGHRDHDMAKEDRTQDKQNCCGDFCISLAIMSDATEFGSPRSNAVSDFLDDSLVFGQLQSLHRPPSIRA